MQGTTGSVPVPQAVPPPSMLRSMLTARSLTEVAVPVPLAVPPPSMLRSMLTAVAFVSCLYRRRLSLPSVPPSVPAWEAS